MPGVGSYEKSRSTRSAFESTRGCGTPSISSGSPLRAARSASCRNDWYSATTRMSSDRRG